MAKRKEKTTLEKIADILEAAGKLARTKKATSGALVAALFGGVLKLSEVTKTFPEPADLVGNVIIFFAVLIIAIDICKGGLLD